MSLIHIQDLSKHFKILNRREGLSGAFKDLFSGDYRTVKAVDGISFDINAGEIVGYIGPNGAGKSTTIKMMTGILKPTDGTILINDHVPYTNRIKQAQIMGVVFGQRTQLWWDLPVIESFKILKEIYKVDQKTFDHHMDMFNELVGLKALYSQQARTLSLGQRMLCDITASFLHNPQVVFLDEPTIGLDISVKAKILVLNGADDPFIKKEQYVQFEGDLDAAKADYKVITYPGAVHAFTNPEATKLGKKFNLPLRYDEKANKAAEAEAAKMFAEVFKK